MRRSWSVLIVVALSFGSVNAGCGSDNPPERRAERTEALECSGCDCPPGPCGEMQVATCVKDPERWECVDLKHEPSPCAACASGPRLD
jgi:hypothetical protein